MNRRKFFLYGLLVAVVGIVAPFMLRQYFNHDRTATGCLSTGTWQLAHVYLDSMLYVNGTETQLLQRLEVTDKFTGNTPTTLDFTGDIGRKIYKGQVRIQYGDTGYGVLFKVDEGSRELSECIQTMVLNAGETLQNGRVRTDTLRNGNQISVRNEKNQDHEGTYRLRNDTLYHSYTPAGWQWQQGFPLCMGEAE